MSDDFTGDFIKDIATAPSAPSPKLKRQRSRKVSSGEDLKRETLAVLKQALTVEPPKSITKTGGRPAVEAFRHFEGAVGGRKALMEILKHCPPNSNGYNLVQRLLEDPEFLQVALDDQNMEVAAKSLGTICRKKKVPLGALVQAFKDAKVAKIALDNLMAVEEEIPEVMTQISRDAQNRWEPCVVCMGRGRRKVINEQGEWARDEEGFEITRLCYECQGSGQVYKNHDFNNRKLFLEQVGLITKDKGPLVAIDQRSVNFGVQGEGSFDSVMKKLDSLVRPAMSNLDEEPVIDVEPEPVPPLRSHNLQPKSDQEAGDEG